MKIIICMGSSCLLRGAYQVTKRFNELISEYRIHEDEVKLEGGYCNGICSSDGVSVNINGELIHDVTVDNVDGIFKEKVLRKLKYSDLYIH
ncbi:TPA: (2Fe-2S) ferredoxin domain-containing protein [bacterium]|jgi:NADH:ubiquinone oxidoreductase subunit E|nr:(2Fe-2S) ferredoxin domain-containing protein [bacterium]